MDFLLIVVAILGFVVAVVMLVLAARAHRQSAESQERAETLEALATGSVLFAHASADDPIADEWEDDDARFDAELPQPLIPEAARFTVLEPAPVPPASRQSAETLDQALSEFADEDAIGSGDVTDEELPVPEAAAVTITSSVFPFVMTVPVAAGVGRVQVSFDRSGCRSRS